MDREAYQKEYVKRSKELDETIEERKQQQRTLKQLGEIDQTAAQLQKKTLQFMEELDADFRGTQMGTFVRDQVDLIQTDFRQAQQNRLETTEALHQNLKQLKQQEEDQEQSRKNLRAEKEGNNHGTETDCQ